MERVKGFIAKTAAGALAASMVFSGTAAAAPIDELNEIMEVQTQGQESLLEQTLGTTAFGEAQKENGLQLQVNVGLSAEDVSELDLEEVLPEGGNLSVNTQIDPALKKWLFACALGTSKENSLLDLSLYGDEEKLALMLPQFFSGAVSLHAGNFCEQYEKSQWKEALGELPEEIPEIELKFWPDAQETTENTLEDIVLAAIDDVEVEKTEDGDTTIYREAIKTEDIVNIYREVFDTYLNSDLMQSGLVSVGDMDEFESDLEQMYTEMEDMLGEETEVLFYVRDNMVEKITYSLQVDTSDYVVSEETDAQGEEETENDTIIQADESFEGTVDYEIVFADPANALDGMDMNMTVNGTDGTEYAKMALAYRVETEGSVEKTTASVTMAEEGETLYEGTPFVMTFDSATGDFDILVEVEGQLKAVLDATFTDIEKGKSFRLAVDELSFGDGAKQYGISGDLFLSTDPGEIAEPEEEKELLAMTQEEIMSFVMEIQSKATSWAAQFIPEETESTTEETTEETTQSAGV